MTAPPRSAAAERPGRPLARDPSTRGSPGARASRAPAGSTRPRAPRASKLESGGSPTAPAGRSRGATTTPSLALSSSSFTISCPRRALVGQCTRRSDSPCSYSRTEWKSKPADRRSRSRRPSPPARPASLNRPSSSTSRGHTTTRAGSHETAGESDDEAEQISEDDLASRKSEHTRGIASEVELTPRRSSVDMQPARPLPESTDRRGQTSSNRAETGTARRTSSAIRTRSPSVAGVGWTRT